ncbi:nuclear transport factor 2 family protein [Pseudomonas sp. RGM2987]|uniref:nuclear transport factor 2 family protein n=1 Tax=Pseudomonas sp. RGM2987 TaxID=2930090 RepID=UPI001FD717E4|nr:nuclear transport factor 2 family protein [Pseudomonas sp. RGM2987]MCJ8207953.1 nuclear transport factor 2 family protein [Pseudomonas sp. RGM2987]
MTQYLKRLILTVSLVLAGGATAEPVIQARDTAVEEANRQLVLTFYDGFFNRHDTVQAAKVVADDYRQHNPGVPDGKAPLVDYFTGFFKSNPQSRARIMRSAADGDLVWLQVHSTNGEDDLGRAVLDIFRVKDGQIVEHWDVIQDVPEKSANPNTMF